MRNLRRASTFTAWIVAALATPSAAAPESGEPIAFDAGLATGSWPDSVTIAAPPGPGGGRPTVALIADHRVVDGVAGSGWRLAAGGAITRHSTTGGAPNFTTGDLYRLDGVDLVYVTSPGTPHFQPRIWDGARLSYAASSNTWTRSVNGWIFVYGSTSGTGASATRLLADAGQLVTRPVGGFCTTELCRTSAWYLSKVTDPFGNVTRYDYVVPPVPAALSARYPWASTRHHQLDRISYGAGHEVKLGYAPRPDTRLEVIHGRAALITERLREIVTRTTDGTYARYVIQYEGESTAGALATPLTDCDGAPVVADARIEQSLIQKIVRVGAGADASPQHTLRCLRLHHERSAWSSDATAEVLDTLDAPGDGLDALAESAVPIAVNLDGDPVTDLIVLGMTAGGGGVSARHRAYVATPARAERFAAAGAAGQAGVVAQRWQDQLALRLGNAMLSAERGYALVDLDGDTDTELLYEDAAGAVSFDRFDLATLTFSTATTALTGCDLRYAEFDDVDGDGEIDAVIKAHPAEGGCAAQTTTRWIRNSGAAPWLSSSAGKAAALPPEVAGGSAAWDALFAAGGACASLGVAPPVDWNSRWSASDATAYLADHVRFGDVNHDGIVDAMVALYGCWEQVAEDLPTPTVNETEWEPVDGSQYSQIFFGDGRGGWISSLLPAGPPLTYEFIDPVAGGLALSRLAAGVLGAADLDRNGKPELMTTTPGTLGTRLMVSPYHSLLDGFAVGDTVFDNEEDPTGDGEVLPQGLELVGRAAPCYERSRSFAFGDFDGDGMPDLLTFELNDSPDVGLCAAGEWCAVLRPAQRAAVEGRMISSDGAHGGRTTLTWGFVGAGEHANPNLATNLEVIEHIDGAEGVVELVYGGAFTSQGGGAANAGAAGRPTPFAEVTRRNLRGGVDLLAFVTAPWAEGQPSHAARYRSDGSLDHVSVFSYGTADGSGMWMYTAAPYFAPLARQCEYQIGHAAAGGVQTTSLAELIRRCYEFGGGPPVVAANRDLAGMRWVANDDLPVALGHTDGELSPGSAPVFAASFGATAVPQGSISLDAAWDYGVAAGLLEDHPPFLRWPVPGALAGMVPAVAGAEAGYAPPVAALPTEIVEHIDDWSYELAVRRLALAVEHRDTATSADDRRHAFVFHQVSSVGHWYRMVEDRVTDAAATLLEVRSLGYPLTSSYTPSSETICRAGPASCRTTTTNVVPSSGDLIGRGFADGSSESWQYGGCGLATRHVDAAGRVRDTRYDGCRPERITFEGGAQDLEYDGLGRVIREVTDPGGGAAVTIVDLYYDDTLELREDSGYDEPRIARRRGDLLELTYLDGFGRVTRRLECAPGGPTAGRGGVLGQVNCLPDTTRIVEWNLYGSDGLRKVSVEPMFRDELPRTRGYAHDGAGREVVVMEPAHVAAGPGWDSTTIHHGPSWTTAVDALGRAHRRGFSTLERTHSIDGVARSSERVDVEGRRVEVTAADGQVTRFEYDGKGNLSRLRRIGAVDCTVGGAVTACQWEHRYVTHDGVGRVLVERDAAGVELRYTYDGLGRVLTTTVAVPGEPAVVVERRSYTAATAAAPATATITDEHGAVTTITYDGLERPVTTELLDTTTSTTWGEDGLVAHVVDGNGRTTLYEHDRHGHRLRTTAPGGVITTYQHDGAGRLLEVTDADGVTLQHAYTYAGDLASTTRAGRWQEVEVTYDAGGRPVSELAAGVRSKMAWDHLDRLERRDEGLDAGGQARVTTHLSYDSGDRLTERRVVPRTGSEARWRFAYDAWGRAIGETDPAGATWTTERDVIGRAVAAVDPLGHRLATTYDGRGRVVARQTPAGQVYAAYHAGGTYTPVGQSSAIGALAVTETWDDADTAAARTLHYRDALGRTLATRHKDGAIVEHVWSGDERVAELWFGPGATTPTHQRDHDFDARGWLARVDGPYRPGDAPERIDHVIFEYTAAGRPLRRTTPETTTTFTHEGGLLASEAWDDQLHRWLRDDSHASWITGETWTSGPRVRTRSLDRDPLGRLERVTDAVSLRPSVVVTRSGFDVFGAPASETRSVGGVVAATTTWVRDAAGRPTSRTVTPRGGSAAVTQWAWRSNGQLTRVTTPSGLVTAYDYGDDLLLDRVGEPGPGGGDRAVVVARNGRGQITALDQPSDGTTRWFGYDAMGRRTAEGQGPLGAPTASWIRTFDGLGRLTSQEHLSSTAAWTDRYTYDGRGRLETETRGAAGETRRYTWSTGGNLLSTERSTDGVTWTTVASATYAGQRATHVGGVALAYDAWQRVTLDQHGNAFTYDSDGEVASVTGPGATAVELVRDAAGVPVAHLEGGAVARQLAWGLDSAELPLEVLQSDGVPHAYVQGFGELLGTDTGGVFTSAQRGPRDELVRSGTETVPAPSAFGDELVAPAGAPDERFGFAGLETVRGAAGVFLARHRVYDAATGRFLAPDPIGLDGGDHRFAYADGDPVQKVDPLGFAACFAASGTPTIVPERLVAELYEAVAPPNPTFIADAPVRLRSGRRAIDVKEQSRCTYFGCPPDDGGDTYGPAGTRVVASPSSEPAPTDEYDVESDADRKGKGKGKGKDDGLGQDRDGKRGGTGRAGDGTGVTGEVEHAGRIKISLRRDRPKPPPVRGTGISFDVSSILMWAHRTLPGMMQREAFLRATERKLGEIVDYWAAVPDRARKFVGGLGWRDGVALVTTFGKLGLDAAIFAATGYASPTLVSAGAGVVSSTVQPLVTYVSGMGQMAAGSVGMWTADTPAEAEAAASTFLDGVVDQGLGGAELGLMLLTDGAAGGARTAGRTAWRAADDVGGVCFDAGTPVQVEGGTVPIEAVRPGQRVWSRDERSGEVALREVTRTFVSQDREVLTVRVARAGGAEEAITATPEHPFWSPGRGWVAASALAPGDALTLRDGVAAHVVAVERDARRRTVYNLEVAGTHTYFVGDVGVWVHNMCMHPAPTAESVAETVEALGQVIQQAERLHGGARLEACLRCVAEHLPQHASTRSKNLADEAVREARDATGMDHVMNDRLLEIEAGGGAFTPEHARELVGLNRQARDAEVRAHGAGARFGQDIPGFAARLREIVEEVDARRAAHTVRAGPTLPPVD